MTPFPASYLNEPDLTSSLANVLKDPIIHKNTLLLPNPYTEDDAMYYLKRCVEDTEAQRQLGLPPLKYAIREVIGDVKPDGDVEYGRWVGTIRLLPIKGQEHVADLGYYLANEYRGQGVMPQCLRKVCEMAFTTGLNIERIQAIVLFYNEASKRVLVKCGFKYEGRLRSYHNKAGVGILDGDCYSLVRSDFEDIANKEKDLTD
ncbi:hypothetical protein HDU76_012120 [Blyttiomyces sp. JEL0837]|nr:hypothetical protein HDU76_012120 [Blyttiomyces sp. JEL0837]